MTGSDLSMHIHTCSLNCVETDKAAAALGPDAVERGLAIPPDDDAVFL